MQKIKFVDIKTTTTLAVVAYFTLNGLLTLWLWFGERGLVFAGNRGEGWEKVELKLRSLPPHRKYDPVYRLKVSWEGAGSKGENEVKEEFRKFYMADGTLQASAFEEWLRRAVPGVAGSVSDMGRTSAAAIEGGVGAKSGQRELDSSAGEEDTIVLGTGTGAATPADTPRKRGRPRKTESYKG